MTGYWQGTVLEKQLRSGKYLYCNYPAGRRLNARENDAKIRFF